MPCGLNPLVGRSDPWAPSRVLAGWSGDHVTLPGQALQSCPSPDAPPPPSPSLAITFVIRKHSFYSRGGGGMQGRGRFQLQRGAGGGSHVWS